MKNRFIISLLLFLPLALMLTSCGVKHRIKKHQDYFDLLPSETQELIQKKQIKAGFEPKMVYLAWGKPDDKSTQIKLVEKKRKRRGKKKKIENAVETWIYTRYGTDYGREYIRVYDSERNRYRTHLVNVRRSYLVMDRYVIFEDGKVTEFGRPNYTFYSPLTTIYPSYCSTFGISSIYGCGSFDRMFIPYLKKLKK